MKPFLAVLLILGGGAVLGAQTAQLLPTGQLLTPLAPPGARLVRLNPHLADEPAFTAGQAVSSLLSPDGRTLLILTSGYNQQNFAAGPKAGKVNPEDSNQYVFVFDVAGGAPRQIQVLRIHNTFSGIALAPDGNTLLVSGGNDDNVHVLTRERSGSWIEPGAPVELGHKHGLGSGMEPEAAGVGVAADGNTAVVANFENDSITVLRRRGEEGSGSQAWSASSEVDLRPGKNDPAQRGVPGGEYPFWVVIKGNDTAYISSVRDRQVVVVGLSSSAPRILARIPLPGQPNKMILNRAQTRLLVTQDNADAVAVISTASNRVLEEIPVTAPAALFADRRHLFGVNPNALALSPDERTLYVSNGGENAIAVVQMGGASPSSTSQVVGLIPTAWYPNAVTPSGDGRTLYVVNGKSDDGPNPLWGRGLDSEQTTAIHASNQYILQMDKAGFQTIPVPNPATLDRLTRRVLANNHVAQSSLPPAAVFAALRKKITHVIYIIKENRTYDQVLGDLPGANGDADLVEFPQPTTPNFHALAADFVALDHFFCSSEVSGDGWSWSTSARTTDMLEKEVPPSYANRGLSYDTEGDNRNINLAAPRPDPDLLPTASNLVAPDYDDQRQQGYLWDAALRHHLSVRDYGFWVDGNYDQNSPGAIPELTNPFATRTVVAVPTSPSLKPYTDPYFRGFDQNFPDFYRFEEWQREFDAYAAGGDLPNLELIRLEHDHFGDFATALDHLDTPEMQIADDDYAVGLVIQKVAHSRFKDSTLVFVVEDDAQDGGDHVDAHRSPAFIVGPYVRHHAVVSTPYNTVSLLRTMEEILGLAPLNLNDASAAPMADVFDLAQAAWEFTATPSRLLAGSTLPLPPIPGPPLRPTHDGAYWARLTRGMDFSIADHLDSGKFNQILWQGLKPQP